MANSVPMTRLGDKAVQDHDHVYVHDHDHEHVVVNVGVDVIVGNLALVLHLVGANPTGKGLVSHPVSIVAELWF